MWHQVKKKKTATLAALVRKLDTVFSKYIRRRDADAGGTVACVTCNRLLHWKECHAGHFVRRQHMALRWNEENVHPQCIRCNTFLDGNEAEYSRFIIKRYGMHRFEEMLTLKHSTMKWTREELQTRIAYYASFLKALGET